MRNSNVTGLNLPCLKDFMKGTYNFMKGKAKGREAPVMEEFPKANLVLGVVSELE